MTLEVQLKNMDPRTLEFGLDLDQKNIGLVENDTRGRISFFCGLAAMLQHTVLVREGKSLRLSYLYLCYDPDFTPATLVAHAKFVNLVS